MAIVNPVSDAYEALLATPTTRAAVIPTTASNFEVALDALLTRTTSKRTTEPLVELEPPVEERYASLPGETDDAEERSETEVLEELPTIAQYTRATTTRRATGSEDAFQSYLRDTGKEASCTPTLCTTGLLACLLPFGILSFKLTLQKRKESAEEGGA